MDAQTRGLLRECSAGCKMAINSFNQIRDYVTDENLKSVLDTYDKKHKKYEETAAKLLEEGGSEEKEPGVMAAAFFPAEHTSQAADERRQQPDRQAGHGWMQHGHPDPGQLCEPV